MVNLHRWAFPTRRYSTHDTSTCALWRLGIPSPNHLAVSRIYFAGRMDWLRFDEQGHFRTATGEQRETPLGQRQTYFLDPWNNAYWVRMQGFGPVFLFSFGPNRRLDTVLSEDHGVPTPDEIRGDDVGVWIDPFRNHRERETQRERR